MPKMRTVAAGLMLLGWCHPQALHGQTDLTDTDGSLREPARRYRVSAEDSEVLIRVFRAGALARLGHNHVIAANRVEGTVVVDGASARSSFVLRVPVEALEVDNPELRRRSGDDFAKDPSAADIEGTRDNLLGTRVLDAAEYPIITVSGTTEGTTSVSAANVRFEVKQNSAEKMVPIAALVTDQSITVSGELSLSHEELGLKPFSALMGAIRVAELMEVSFRIIAAREE